MEENDSINTNNKLIAEFMGYVQIEEHAFLKESSLINSPSSLLGIDDFEYHSSWDWLHPVYRKVAEIGLWMMTNGHDKLWLEKSKEIEYAMLNEETPEKAAMKISQLIKWYNQNKQP